MINEYKRLLEQLQWHEGFRAYPYRCPAGKLTIGYGRNLEDNGISKAEASELLKHDVGSAIESVERVIGDVEAVWLMEHDIVRLCVLINMAYNMGMPTLKQFHNMLAAVGNHDWDTAADEMLNSRWADQVGARATELAEQMRTGEWQDASN